MLIPKLPIIFFITIIAIVSADILQIFISTTTTRKPTVAVGCFSNYDNLAKNYTELDGGKKYFLSKKKDHWINATPICRRGGLKFATLNSSTEQDQFIELLNGLDQKLLTSYIFVGGKKRRKEGTTNNRQEYEWFWYETGVAINYNQQWATGQPNDRSSEECLAFSKNTGFWRMHDVPCENFKGQFFCQK